MSDALLHYPDKWKCLLNPFGSCFTKPQFANFCHTTTAIAISQYSSIRRWAGLFQPKHQSTLNDFLSISPWDDKAVHNKLSTMTARLVKDSQIGIIDDTLSHHPYAEKMAHVGWFYDGLTKKEEKGNSIVTHCLHSPTLGTVPFGLELYKKEGRSKNDIASAMIKRTQRYKKLPLYLVDSWYSNIHVLSTIKKHNSHFITEIKSNRNVTIDNKKRWVREHEKSILKKQWKTILIKESEYRYFQTSAFISGLGNVNLVFSQKYYPDDKKWSETYYLITDILTLSGNKVIEFILLRGGIEGFHREAKQQLGLEHYQLRNSRGIERYLFLVLLVYVMLMLLNQRQMRNTFEAKTIGEMREDLKAAYHTMLLQEAEHMSRKDIEEMSKKLARGL